VPDGICGGLSAARGFARLLTSFGVIP
jgi:hypothetical protein